MASLGLAPDEFKQLELVRNRFAQLAESLKSIHSDIYHSNPLPSPERLQNYFQILRTSITSIQELIDDNHSLFSRLAIHPSTNFPGRTHEHILQHLLRKKLEPDVEAIVENARKTARAAGIDASKLSGGEGARGGYGDGNNYGLDDGDVGEDEDEVPSDPLNEHWADIREACHNAIKDYALNQSREPYTIEEQAMGTKNVRTGLRRSLEDSDDEEDDDEDDEDEDLGGGGSGGNAGAGPGQGVLPGGTARLEPEHLLRLTGKGDMTLPKNTELVSQAKDKKARKPGPGMPGPGPGQKR
ncbi:mediator of RNA polymerase II transcription subunit 8 [Podospora conica]|nr:mediator of RNA polymerase II transcription subunit 8 [Schizothecium conicum]